MTHYIVRRLVAVIPLLWAISLLAFGIIHFSPGDPTRLLIAPETGTAEQYSALRAKLGLDEPIAVQYFKTIKALATGELRSFKTHQLVVDVIVDRLPTTVSLGLLALTTGFLIGLSLGVAQALYPHSWVDSLGTIISLIGFSMPPFWTAIIFVQLFAVRLHWFPASGIRSVESSGWNPLQVAPYLVLPTLVLAMDVVAIVAQHMRSSMLDALASDYVRTARAKGVPERRVVMVHALRNSLLPLITLAGQMLPLTVTGAVAVESIFALPGVGRLAIEAVYSRDYPVILTVTLFGALVVIIGNLLADIAYTWADPRIRY